MNLAVHSTPASTAEAPVMHTRTRPSTRRDCGAYSAICAISNAERAFLVAVRSPIGLGRLGDGEPCRVGTVVLRKRSRGPAPTGPPSAALRQGTAIRPGPGCPWRQAGCPAPPGALRRFLARAGCGADIPGCPGFALTQRQHKPGAQAKINTEVTRTKRHSPAYGGTRSTIAMSENSASSQRKCG
jgi:hypothetical protein